MTDFKLTAIPTIRYTIIEHQFFNSLPKDGSKVDSRYIADARKKMGDWPVKYPLKNVTVTMARLKDKIAINDEMFRIYTDTKRPGHPEVEYWVAEAKPKKTEQPKTADVSVPMVVQMHPPELERLDRWIGKSDISRPEAVRQLVKYILDIYEEAV